MPFTSPKVIGRYKEMKAKTQNDILYIVDAKLSTQEKGYALFQGKPGQAKKSMSAVHEAGGYASFPYVFKTFGHYSNGHLDVLNDQLAESETANVYVAYVWYDTATPEQGKIFVGKSVYKKGSICKLGAGTQGKTTFCGDFTAEKTTGTAFSLDDYEQFYPTNGAANDWFREYQAAEFKTLLDSVGVVWACGGNTFRYVHVMEKVRGYGDVILSHVKAGKAVYIGQSAGTVALSSLLGHLTSDPTVFELHNATGNVQQFDEPKLLGQDYVEPTLNETLALTDRSTCKLVFRPHLRLDDLRVASSNVKGIMNLPEGSDCTKTCAFVTVDKKFNVGMGGVVVIGNQQITYVTSDGVEKTFEGKSWRSPDRFVRTKVVTKFKKVKHALSLQKYAEDQAEAVDLFGVKGGS
jgi:hypothetical protein